MCRRHNKYELVTIKYKQTISWSHSKIGELNELLTLYKTLILRIIFKNLICKMDVKAQQLQETDLHEDQ